MLHIIDNYYAQTNNYGYSVLRDTGKKNPKTDKEIYSTLVYVGTIKEVLELVKKDIVHNHIKEHDLELAQAFWIYPGADGQDIKICGWDRGVRICKHYTQYKKLQCCLSR